MTETLLPGISTPEPEVEAPAPEPEVTPSAPDPAAAPPVDKVMEALMARIQVVSEAPPYSKTILYGPPGCGKTVLAARSPKPLVLAIESAGIESLLNHEDTRNVPRMQYMSTVQLDYLLDKIRDGMFPQYETLVIDSGTVLQQSHLDQLVAAECKQDASRNPLVPQLQDYNANNNYLRRIAYRLEMLPMNVVLTAHAREVKDEGTGAVLIRPHFPDKLVTAVTHHFSVLGYMTREAGTFKMQLEATPRIMAKSRKGLPSTLEGDDLLRIYTTPIAKD